MEKTYIAPEFEVLKCELLEDVLGMSTESTVPIQTDEPILPDPESPTIEDF